MSVEGRIEIDITRGTDGPACARVSSSRPLALTRLFAGRPADEIVALLPLLYNVCGMAQAHASVSACEKALQIRVDDVTHYVRNLLVLGETAREHLLRIESDWPLFFGRRSSPGSIRRVMGLDRSLRLALKSQSAFRIGQAVVSDGPALRQAVAELENLIVELVFAEPTATWRTYSDIPAIAGWTRAGATPSQALIAYALETDLPGESSAQADFLPDLDETMLARRLLGPEADDFVRLPTWNGFPRETTPLSRQATHPAVGDVIHKSGASLAARLLARLVELAEIPNRMSILADQMEKADQRAAKAEGGRESGVGVAQVEAARGRLVHCVEIERGLVRHYRILAPTEWNFHPQGVVARGLVRMASAAAGSALSLADLFIKSIDPCVGYELKVV